VRIAYVDGAALEAELNKFSPFLAGEKIDFNYHNFLQTLHCQRVFFYDSLPIRKNGESEVAFAEREFAKQEFFKRLSQNSNVHVKTGTSRFNKKRGHHQKAVDVLLATDALYDALTGVSEYSVFVLSDLDFYPVFERLAHTKSMTSLWYWKGATASDLIESADGAYELGFWQLTTYLSEHQKSLLMPFTIDGAEAKATEAELTSAVRGTIDGDPCAFWYEQERQLYVGCLRQHRIETPHRQICLEYWVQGAMSRLIVDESKLP